MKCNNCGSELKPGAGFCENCGMIISIDGVADDAEKERRKNPFVRQVSEYGVA